MTKSDDKSKTQKQTSNPAKELLLLAISHQPFQEKVKAFRTRYKISPPFFVKSDDDANNFLDAIDALDELIEWSRLPRSSSIRQQVWNYIAYDKIETVGATRYKITVDPPFKTDRDGKIHTYSRSVNLVTYAKLSPIEQQQAIKSLKNMQKLALHPIALRDVRALKNTENNLEIEKAMQHKRIPHLVENYVSCYVDMMFKKFLAGKITQQEFNNIKKLNPHGVEKKKEGLTSKNVAKEKFGTSKKHNVVRKKVERLKKMRMDFLGS